MLNTYFCGEMALPILAKKIPSNFFQISRRLTIQDLIIRILQKDTLNDNTPPLPLKDKLTYVRDTSECFMTRLGLAEGLFTHLITLNLSFPIKYGYKGNPLLRLLKNMPVLKHLGLDNTTITIDDFEILHANIPSLESLKISEMRLILSNFPAKIKPTSAFTSLEVYGEFEDPQTKYDWFKYIIEKYPRLVHLIYSIREWTPKDFDKNSLVLRADSRDVVRKLGPQLQTLSYYDDMDILSEEVGTSRQKWSLKKMILRQSISQGQLTSLVQLYQFKFAENLDLCISRLPFPLTKLKKMAYLKVLRLTFYQWNNTPSDGIPESALEDNKSAVLNLDELFWYLLSSVESMHLYCRYAGFDGYDSGTQYTNIKKLILEVLEPQKKNRRIYHKTTSQSLFTYSNRLLPTWRNVKFPKPPVLFSQNWFIPSFYYQRLHNNRWP